MASLVLTVKAGRAGRTRCSAARPSARRFRSSDIAKPLVGAATTYFVFNTLLIATAIGLSDAAVDRARLERELPLERAELLRRRRRGGDRRDRDRQRRLLVASLAAAPLYLTYRTYKVYMGRIQDQQRHVAQVSDLHLATIEALALAIDAKDQTAQSHIRRVQVYAAGLARALGMPDNEIQGVKTAALLHDIGKLAVPEHILSKPGPADPGGIPEDPHSSAGRRRNHQRRAVPVSGGAADPQPPRAVGWQGLSERPEGRRHPARRAHPLGRRLLRRADVGAALPQGDEPRRRDGPAPPGKRQGARPARGPDLHRHVSDAGGGSRSEPGAGAEADPRADPRADRGAGRGARGRDLVVGAHERLPGHRARAPGDLRAVRDRAGDGQQPRRLRHDGAHLVEAEQHRAVLVLRAVPLQRRNRNAALPLRDRRRSRGHPAADDPQRPGPHRLGGAQPPAARQRAAEHRPRSGGRRLGSHDAAFGARLPAALQRAVHRHDFRVPHRDGRSTPTTIAGCSIAFPSRPRRSSTTRWCSSRRRKIR